MQQSYAGRKFLEEQEGYKAKAYKDSKGVWTIGYGTTFINGKPVQEGMTCTQAEAELWLAADTAKAQSTINKVVRAPMTQNMFDALVSFVYNVGIEAFTTSTMLKFLNFNQPTQAAIQFLRWDMSGGKHIPGLYARRLREQSLFEK